MKSYFLLLFMLSLLGCSQKQQSNIGETEWQIKKNAEFKDASTSPLKAKDLKNFKGLNFYKFDSAYVVKAKLRRVPNAEWFNMKTTTGEVSKERVYAIAIFAIKGEEFQLNIYQGKRNMNTIGFKDYLFLPFLDDTNGNGSYGGGRYINLRIPKSDTIEIDFNKAYNPYCVYNDKFSCLIVPRDNYLPIEVKVGMRTFKKD